MLRQIARFGLIGVLATVVHISVATTVQLSGLFPPLLSNSAGFLVAFTVSYLGHLRYTFQKIEAKRDYLIRFVILSGSGYLISSAVVFAVTGLWGGSFVMAMAMVAILVPAFSFLAARYWVFHDG